MGAWIAVLKEDNRRLDKGTVVSVIRIVMHDPDAAIKLFRPAESTDTQQQALGSSGVTNHTALWINDEALLTLFEENLKQRVYTDDFQVKTALRDGGKDTMRPKEAE